MNCCLLLFLESKRDIQSRYPKKKTTSLGICYTKRFGFYLLFFFLYFYLYQILYLYKLCYTKPINVHCITKQQVYKGSKKKIFVLYQRNKNFLYLYVNVLNVQEKKSISTSTWLKLSTTCWFKNNIRNMVSPKFLVKYYKRDINILYILKWCKLIMVSCNNQTISSDLCIFDLLRLANSFFIAFP